MGERLLKTAVLSATLGIALIAFSGMSLASDDFAGGCKRKEQAIETKMEYARKHGNQEQLRGLEEALSQVRRWCSDGTLRSKAELNILEKQDKGAASGSRQGCHGRQGRKENRQAAAQVGRSQRGAGAGRCEA